MRARGGTVRAFSLSKNWCAGANDSTIKPCTRPRSSCSILRRVGCLHPAMVRSPFRILGAEPAGALVLVGASAFPPKNAMRGLAPLWTRDPQAPARPEEVSENGQYLYRTLAGGERQLVL